VITLEGGTAGAMDDARGDARVLAADPLAGQSMTQAARMPLRRVDWSCGEFRPLRDTIANLKTFSARSPRNADRVDGILQAWKKWTGAVREMCRRSSMT